jgi:hypothetical protein
MDRIPERRLRWRYSSRRLRSWLIEQTLALSDREVSPAWRKEHACPRGRCPRCWPNASRDWSSFRLRQRWVAHPATNMTPKCLSQQLGGKKASVTQEQRTGRGRQTSARRPRRKATGKPKSPLRLRSYVEKEEADEPPAASARQRDGIFRSCRIAHPEHLAYTSKKGPERSWSGSREK